MIVESQPVHDLVHCCAPCPEPHAVQPAYLKRTPKALRGRVSQQSPLRLIDAFIPWALIARVNSLPQYWLPRSLCMISPGAMVSTTDEEGGVSETPEYRFKAVRARLQGFELEARHRLPESLTGRDWQLDLSGQLDAVQGRNLDSGEPLPRLAPLRAGLALEARHGPWGMKLELRRASAQNRVNAQDQATAGYTMLKAALTRQFSLGGSDATWFLKLDNLNNALAYSSSSMLQMRGLSPLPGRSVQTGVQVRF